MRSCLEKQWRNMADLGGGSANAHWPHLESFLRAPFHRGLENGERLVRRRTVFFFPLPYL